MEKHENIGLGIGLGLSLGGAIGLVISIFFDQMALVFPLEQV